VGVVVDETGLTHFEKLLTDLNQELKGSTWVFLGGDK
jgi:hypothetical protein